MLCRELVITIHGVNPDRKWQERVGKVLEPHFNCKTFSYGGYDTFLGPIRAVASLPALALVMVLVVAFVSELRAGQRNPAVLFLAAAILSLAASVLLARLRRVRSTHFIKQQVGATSVYRRPHVVAHSLGTYLIGNALRKFPDIHLGHVVLVSSVLPRAYPWQSLLRERPSCVLQVRNEFGSADRVTRLVGGLQWLVPDLGPSGAVGFARDANVVHTAVSPLADCVYCRTAPVKVHNVPLKCYAHSTVFLGDLHARKLWLPFLWGYSPDEFFHYLETCQTAARFHQEGRLNEVGDVLAELWGSVFTWTKGKSLFDFVKDLVAVRLKQPPPPATPGSVDELVERTMTVLHIVTEEACSEAEKQGPTEESVLRGLDPHKAIVRAVERIFGEKRST
jgi:hypothetical protein